jgi:hypothetical protein
MPELASRQAVGRIALTNGDYRALIGQIVLRAKQSNAALYGPQRFARRNLAGD